MVEDPDPGVARIKMHMSSLWFSLFLLLVLCSSAGGLSSVGAFAVIVVIAVASFPSGTRLAFPCESSFILSCLSLSFSIFRNCICIRNKSDSCLEPLSRFSLVVMPLLKIRGGNHIVKTTTHSRAITPVFFGKKFFFRDRADTFVMMGW